MLHVRALLASLILLGTLAGACAVTSSGAETNPDEGRPPPTGGGPADPGAFGLVGDQGKDPSCASAAYVATKAPLALQLMLDRSDSMRSTTASGATKWAGAKMAIASFLASSTASVGLSYFPVRAPGVPATCTTNAQCGAYGPCGTHVCIQAGGAQTCDSSLDCGGNPCAPVGKCSIADKLCLPSSADPCGPGGGMCILSCANEASCAVADYVKAAVPIGLASQTKGAIASSLMATQPFGDTPTGPALGGALAAAEDFANAHSGFVAAAVLVTDGIATDCGLTDPQSLAALAAAGAKRGVRTFVVGIFAPAEEAEARANLDAIAAGGSTDKAIVVKTSTNVATELAAVLDDIRTRAVPCEYAMPVPENGAVVDPKRVNVIVTPQGSSSSTVPFVDGREACGLAVGWHYDATSPSKIVLCPKTCDAVVKTAGIKVDLVTGCQTVIR